MLAGLFPHPIAFRCSPCYGFDRDPAWDGPAPAPADVPERGPGPNGRAGRQETKYVGFGSL
jgi:hypothetical protein